MKKRVIAILSLAIILCSVLAFSASAASIDGYNRVNYYYNDYSGEHVVVGANERFVVRYWYDDIVLYDNVNEPYATVTRNYYSSASVVDVDTPYDEANKDFYYYGIVDNTHDDSVYITDWAYKFTYYTEPDENGMIVHEYDALSGALYNELSVYVQFFELNETERQPLAQHKIQKGEYTYSTSVVDAPITLPCYQITYNGYYLMNITYKYVNSKTGMVRVFTQECYIHIGEEGSSYYEGYYNGYDDGYNDGYDEGIIKGIEMSSETDYTLRGLINAIILAPFNFVKTAFNFEIFGVNMSSTITFIFTYVIIVSVLIFVIKRLS